MPDERTPLLRNFSRGDIDDDPHAQFCMLTGVPPSILPEGAQTPKIGKKTLYGRALRLRSSQDVTYKFTATVSNTMLLTQVVLGAALTGLGASESSHVLITLFGAMNTIIAGLVAYLKSRGQPMRARMFRDDVERVVDEIENSEIMWLGISKGVHGYEDIDTDDKVTVRSEVARLTRLYERAVRNNTMNNPDMYMANGGFDGNNTALRPRPLPSQPSIPNPPPGPVPPAADIPAPLPVAPAAPLPDPDESPATAPSPPKPKDEPPKDPPKKEEPAPKESSDPSPPPPTSDSPKSDPPSTESPPPPTNAPPQETPKPAPESDADVEPAAAPTSAVSKKEGDDSHDDDDSKKDGNDGQPTEQKKEEPSPPNGDTKPAKKPQEDTTTVPPPKEDDSS